jgi:ribose 5-phosphate isomerase B
VKIVVGSDHAGLQLKNHLKDLLGRWGHEVVDVGTHSTESTDYPDWGVAVGRKLMELGSDARGLCVCGSGIGISMAANKVQGVRAALVHDSTEARLARQHNDANVLCLGQRTTGEVVAEDALKTFLETGFEGGRHQKRVDKLNNL